MNQDALILCILWAITIDGLRSGCWSRVVMRRAIANCIVSVVLVGGCLRVRASTETFSVFKIAQIHDSSKFSAFSGLFANNSSRYYRQAL